MAKLALSLSLSLLSLSLVVFLPASCFAQRRGGINRRRRRHRHAHGRCRSPQCNSLENDQFPERPGLLYVLYYVRSMYTEQDDERSSDFTLPTDPLSLNRARNNSQSSWVKRHCCVKKSRTQRGKLRGRILSISSRVNS